MNKKLIGIAVVCILLLAACQSRSQTAQKEGLGKVLILYYTWSEQANTENAAKIVRGLTGADMVKVEPATPFPDLNSQDMIAWARGQREKQEWPAIKDIGVNPADYDFIFIGTPVWFGTVALPIHTLLLNTDFGGKPAACFAMANSREGDVLNDFSKQIKNAQVREGIAFRMQNETELEEKLKQWVGQMRNDK